MVRPVAVVTGGAGFIGSHMVDLLIDEGFEVRAIDNLVGGREENIKHHSNDPLVFEQRDIRTFQPDDKLFKDAKYVFHFGGIGDIVPSIEQPLDYMSTNVQGTAHMLECARHAGVKKFVYAASSSCYGLADVPNGVVAGVLLHDSDGLVEGEEECEASGGQGDYDDGIHTITSVSTNVRFETPW